MSNRPFRFIHASDFHLEQVPHGIAEIPDSLRDALVDAPYRAAARVFELAIHEHVDFVVLCGDLLAPAEAGPRGWAFLVEQFERLRQQGISVYWAGGAADPPEAWPSAIDLPDNVYIFSNEHAELVTYGSDESPVCHLVGESSLPRGRIRAADFSPPGDGLFTLGVAHADADAEQLDSQRIDYWALGGRHERELLATTKTLAQYCGSPQGRSPAEPGPHGCLIVQVDDQRRARSTFVPTDAVRYLHESLALPPSAQVDRSQRELAQREELQRMLTSRAQALLANHTGPDLLVSWAIRAPEAVASQLRAGTLAADLAGRLRADFAVRKPTLWTTSLVAESVSAIVDRLPSALYDQETILGEFLRTVREWDRDPLTPIDLAPLAGSHHAALHDLGKMSLTDVAARGEILGDVALLGVDLLSPEEARP